MSYNSWMNRGDIVVKCIKYLRESTTDTFSDKVKNSWQYKRLKELEYDVELYRVDEQNTKLVIYFPDGDIYAKFLIHKNISIDFDEMYFIYDIGSTEKYKENITYEVDFTDSYDDCVISCMYYFLTRY